MATKLPLDACEYYYSLGNDRSYQAVADHYGVTKRAVTKRAMKEDWQGRIAERESRVRENVTKRTEESLEEMMARHLRQVKAIQARALEALRSMPLNTAMEACRALGQAMTEERRIRGEPADEGTKSIEQIIKREYERWLVPAGEAERQGEENTQDYDDVDEDGGVE